MTVNEWKNDFKSYIDELHLPKDDYNGIIEYINDGVELMNNQGKEIKFLKEMQLRTIKGMDESELGQIVGKALGIF